MYGWPMETSDSLVRVNVNFVDVSALLMIHLTQFDSSGITVWLGLSIVVVKGYQLDYVSIL